MEHNLPKLMVISINAWRDEGTTHTLINLLSNWKKDRLAQVYARADFPNTKICDCFFRISETSVFKSVFNPKIITGGVVQNTVTNDDAEIAEEHARYAKTRKRHSWLMSLCREGVWLLGHWKTKALDKFLEDFAPDVLFIPIYPTVFMSWIQLYVLKKTGKPAVCYLSDDNYTYMLCGKNPLAYIHRFLLRRQVKRLVKNCSKLFVISPKQKEEYDRIFDVNSIILTKGIDFTNLKYKSYEPQHPIRMVYTGNMIIGRADSLALIADALAIINKEQVRMTLDIYSPDIMDDFTMNRLNQKGCKFHGVVPKNDVEKILASADVVVFVESLKQKHCNAARLSFSTKLTDYFQSGKCIFAIGKDYIAPIDYLQKNDAAIIATTKEQIVDNINLMLNDPQIIMKYSEKSFECGKRNHDREHVKKALINTISDVAFKR